MTSRVFSGVEISLLGVYDIPCVYWCRNKPVTCAMTSRVFSGVEISLLGVL